MFNLWFEMGFGLVIIAIVLGFVVASNRKFRKIKDDSDIIKVVEEELELEGIEHFELKSIVSIGSPAVTHVIVNTGHLEIAMEIDSKSGKILSKERLARQ